jgi:hypothetical protein
LTANLKFINKKFVCFFLPLQCFTLTDNSYSRSKYQSTNKHVPIKHQQMSFVSNGGKFKLYTVPKGLLFQRLLSPGFDLNAWHCRLYGDIKNYLGPRWSWIGKWSGNIWSLRRKSNMHTWKNTRDELKRILSLCIVMGNVKLPSIKHYWSRNIIHYSIERWDAIHLKWFCVTCAFMTTPLLVYIKYTTFSTNIQNTYYPGRNLSLNERGRLYFRQYIPNKAAKYGVKLYELCTPDGFVLNI